MSASWSSDERNRIEKDLEATRSRTKCKSISIFFVHARKSGFALRYLAPMLSHHKIEGGR